MLVEKSQNGASTAPPPHDASRTSPSTCPGKNLINPCHYMNYNCLQLHIQFFAWPCHFFFLFFCPKTAGHRNWSAGLLPGRKPSQREMCQSPPLASTFPIKQYSLQAPRGESTPAIPQRDPPLLPQWARHSWSGASYSQKPLSLSPLTGALLLVRVAGHILLKALGEDGCLQLLGAIFDAWDT